MNISGIEKIAKGARNRRRSSASILLETIIAVPTAAIALAAVYTCFAQGFTIASQQRETLRATQIMLKQLERVRLCTFDQLTNTTYNPQTITDYFDPTDQPSGGGGTVYTVTFTPSVPASGTLPDSYRTNMMLVTVGISWTSNHLQHTNSMQTFIGKNGIDSYVATGQ